MSLLTFLNKLTCSHRHYMLVRYETRNGQHLQLRYGQQYWRCTKCWSNIGQLGGSRVPQA